MDDYISREAAIEAAKSHYPKANEMIAAIILVSSADVRPVLRGKWEKDNSYAGPGLMNLRCSVCGEFGGTWRDCTLPSMLYKFCPHCGADMREPNLDTTKGDSHD